jgi:Leucine-rich repeat (LRR) protein
MKTKLLILFSVFCYYISFTQIVNFPDPNFKEALLNHDLHGGVVIDTNNDGEIQITEAESIVETIMVPGIFLEEKIVDLTGIEAFINITGLNCGGNEISNLNLSNNSFLLSLGCFDNQISSINIGNCPELESLYCQENQLNDIDISSNPNLQNINCSGNQLLNLDISNNPNLQMLHCSENQFVDINLSNNASIENFDCGFNQLSNLDVSNLSLLRVFSCIENFLDSLDVSNNPLIEYLYCWENEIVNLDLSNNINLQNLSCSNNQLINLDLSNNVVLDWLLCHNNQLTSLDVRNGNNTNLYFRAENNPYLTCIYVDDVNYSNTNWSDYKDLTSHFVETQEECDEITTTLTYIPDDNFEQKLIDYGYDLELDDTVMTFNINELAYLDISNSEITDLTGIEDFVMLQTLNCYDNLLTYIDVSNITYLQIINCRNNQLNDLIVTNNTELQHLYCYGNQLTTLDISNNINLEKLSCYDNLLTSLDLSNNTLLDFITVYDNQLTSLDLSNNIVLQSLNCSENQLTVLDVSNNTILNTIRCRENLLSILNTNNNPNLEILSCYNNQLMSLDLKNNHNLIELLCYSNQLNELDVRNGNNVNLWSFNATNNPNLICIFVDDTAWSLANWTHIDTNSHFVETQEECDEITVGINEFIGNPKFIIKPNPVGNSFILSPSDYVEEIRIFNIHGQLVDIHKLQNQYSVSHLDDGFYFVFIEMGNGNIIIEKIIKQLK